MKHKQLSIWSKEEMDIFAPRRKTKRELNKEKKEEFEKKLMERVVLSSGEIEKYNFPLDKKELRRIVEQHNTFCKEEYTNSEKKFGDWIKYRASIINLGVPQMIFTTISQYSKKEQKDLLALDLAMIYMSIKNIFPEVRGINELRKFRKTNNLTFFGGSQYLIIEKYIENLN